MTNIFTIKIPAGFNHRAAIYKPVDINPGVSNRYCIAAPCNGLAEDVVSKLGDKVRIRRDDTEPTVYAVSQKKPIIIIDGDKIDETRWNGLLMDADFWRFPFDKLLIDRPLEIAVELRPVPVRFMPPPGSQPQAAWTLFLHAVKIGGDFEKSDALKAHIAEVKAWFNDE